MGAYLEDEENFHRHGFFPYLAPRLVIDSKKIMIQIKSDPIPFL